jgi:hypothetical protein
MAAPPVLGFLGQRVRENNLTADDLVGKLKAEAPSLQRFLPAEFGSLLGGASHLAGTVPAAVTPAAVAAASAGKRWLWPVIIIIAIILACLWFFNRAKAPAPEAVQTPVTAPAATTPRAKLN